MMVIRTLSGYNQHLKALKYIILSDSSQHTWNSSVISLMTLQCLGSHCIHQSKQAIVAL